MKPKYSVFLAAFSLVALELLLRALGVNDTYLEKVGKRYYSFWGKAHDGYCLTHTPGTTFTEKNIDYTYTNKINSLGHREMEPAQLLGDTNAIVIVGDSYTEGMGVVYDSSFVRHLQRLLAENGRPFPCYNAGVAGSDPLYGYTALRDLLAPFRFRAAMVMINPTDYYDIIYKGGFERFKSNRTTYRKGPWYEPLYHRSYVFRLILHKLFSYMPGDVFMRPDQFEPLCAEINLLLLAAADSIQTLASLRNFRVLFVIHPGMEFIYDLPVNRTLRQLMAQLAAGLKRKDYRVINIYNPMAEKISLSNQTFYGYEHDGHFSSNGYRLMAQAIWDETERNYPDFWKR